MNRKKYNQLRVLTTIFVAVIVSLAVTLNSFVLSLSGVVTGMLFMALVRSKVKIKTDEREVTIQQKAAQMSYAIFAPTIGIGAFLLLMFASNSKEQLYYLEALGMVFAYLTLFLISIYSISYYFFNHQLGGGSEE